MILNGDIVQALLGERLVAINFDHNRCKITDCDILWESFEFFFLETRKRHLFFIAVLLFAQGVVRFPFSLDYRERLSPGR